jgi:hypothetical protein
METSTIVYAVTVLVFAVAIFYRSWRTDKKLTEIINELNKLKKEQ